MSESRVTCCATRWSETEKSASCAEIVKGRTSLRRMVKILCYKDVIRSTLLFKTAFSYSCAKDPRTPDWKGQTEMRWSLPLIIVAASVVSLLTASNAAATPVLLRI